MIEFTGFMFGHSFVGADITINKALHKRLILGVRAIRNTPIITSNIFRV
jgi:hypothetical protein